MCLDPRPDRPFRAARPARSASTLPSLLRSAQAPRPVGLVVRAPALRALEHLAGDDDLIARGWVVLSREA